MQPIWRKSSKYYCYIEMLPFNIVVFVLIIIFLVALDNPIHRHGTAALVKVRHVVPMPNALREDALRVSVERDGKIYFQTMQVRIEDLPMKLRDTMSTASEQKVYI